MSKEFRMSYIHSVKERYLKASKVQKGQIVPAVQAIFGQTALHEKSASPKA
jgi:hypothetical protein